MKLFNGIFKWILSLALALSVGLLIIIFLSSRPELNPFLMRLIMLAAAGFIGGLSARLFFRKLPSLVTVLITFFSNLLAILVIDHFYFTAYQFQFLTNDFKLLIPTVSEASQVLLMTLVSFLPLLTFRRPFNKKSKAQRISTPKKAHKSFSQIIAPVAVKVDPRNWKILRKISFKKPKYTSLKTRRPEKPVLSIARSARSSAHNQPVAIHKSSSVKYAAKKLKLPGKLFNGNQTDVKLVGEEEHVCPYCLEEVNKGDSRGVKVCPECGTWHHEDCWSLTGSCGVAHRTEL